MRTSIDSRGRVVVPASVREAMGLTPGTPIDLRFTDGRIEIEVAGADVSLAVSDGRPRLMPMTPMPELTDQVVRSVVESTRR